MSKVGFRREILGFNREDVIEYIKKTQSETSLREKELVDTLDKLNKRNAELIAIGDLFLIFFDPFFHFAVKFVIIRAF